MNLGAMRHLLHFYAPKQLTNKIGEVKTCYLYAFSGWAAKSEISSQESQEGGKEIAENTLIFKTRFLPINTSFVALYNGNNLKAAQKLKKALLNPSDEVYELISVIDKTGLQKELEIKAKIKEKRS